MARVRPFAAWRYAAAPDITPLTAPPYDVISPAERAGFLEGEPHNVVALELPDGPLDPSAPGNRYETGKATWDAWRTDGTLVRESVPSLYVLEQRYTLGEREIKRRAFIVEVGLEPFDAGVVLPHERTLAKALGDRFELTRATGANLSQVFSLYDDPDCETDSVFSAVMASDPVATATDADGVVSTLWASSDTRLAEQLAAFMDDRQLFIADGHHRYTTALAYRDERRAQAAATGEYPVDPAYDFVMMALVNMDDPDLVVLPTHRVANGNGAFDPAAFKDRLAEHFTIEELPAGHPAAALADAGRPAFLVLCRGDERPWRAILRADVDLDAAIPLDRTLAWKELDVAALQELVLDPLLGIHPDRPESMDRLTFVKDAHAAMRLVGEHDVAFVLRATRMDQLRSVALAGEIMPQKSTYFYPKLLSGMLFRSAE